MCENHYLSGTTPKAMLTIQPMTNGHEEWEKPTQKKNSHGKISISNSVSAKSHKQYTNTHTPEKKTEDVNKVAPHWIWYNEFIILIFTENNVGMK